MGVKVSVIVPVYNAENNLVQCMDSIINQSLQEIEIICVDDGSSDRSKEILESYAQTDPRIRILFQQHRYAGTARNYGLENANGEYVVFWDSDDYYKKNALKEMYEKCKEDDADICICGGRHYYDQLGFEAPAPRYIRKQDIPEVIPFNRHSAPDQVLMITSATPWNKMFRRSFIEKEGIRFKPCRNANDVFFVVSALALAESITIVNKGLVVYRKNKTGGLVTTVSQGLMTALKTWEETADYLKERDAFPQRGFANRALESFIYLLNNTSDWDAYLEGYQYIRDVLADKLGIVSKEDVGYYSVSWHNEAARRLRENAPEEFCKWLETMMFLQADVSAGRQRKNDENNRKRIRKIDAEKDVLTREHEQLKADYANLQENCMRLEKELSASRKELTAIKASKTYRYGKKLAAAPRRVKAMFVGRRGNK